MADPNAKPYRSVWSCECGAVGARKPSASELIVIRANIGGRSRTILSKFGKNASTTRGRSLGHLCILSDIQISIADPSSF